MTERASLFSLLRRLVYRWQMRRDKSCHCGWCVECLGWGPY
jgi:hypothetical protein